MTLRGWRRGGASPRRAAGASPVAVLLAPSTAWGNPGDRTRSGHIATASYVISSLARPGPGGADLPDAVRAVIGHEQAAVTRHGHADGPAPPRQRFSPGAVIDDEAGEEVFERTGLAVVHRKERDLVARRHRAVPRPVERHE